MRGLRGGGTSGGSKARRGSRPGSVPDEAAAGGRAGFVYLEEPLEADAGGGGRVGNLAVGGEIAPAAVPARVEVAAGQVLRGPGGGDVDGVKFW